MGTGTTVRVNPLFDGINDAAYETLTAGCTMTEVEPRGVIITQGEKGDKLYVLLDGEVLVMKGIKPVAQLDAPNWFGELALIDNAPRSATVVAKTSCRLLIVPKGVLLDAVSKDPTLSLRMLRGYVNKLRADMTPPIWKSKLAQVIALALLLVALKVIFKIVPGDFAKVAAKALSDDFTTILTGAMAVMGFLAKKADDKKTRDSISGKG